LVGGGRGFVGGGGLSCGLATIFQCVLKRAFVYGVCRGLAVAIAGSELVAPFKTSERKLPARTIRLGSSSASIP
jgi:hypothetical protein